MVCPPTICIVDSLGNIQHLPINHHPTVLLRIMLGDLLHRILPLALLVRFPFFLGLGRGQLLGLNLGGRAVALGCGGALSRHRRFGSVSRDGLLLLSATRRGTGPRELEVDILRGRVDANLGLEELLSDARDGGAG